jgi:hypothetical protein
MPLPLGKPATPVTCPLVQHSTVKPLGIVDPMAVR